MANCGEHSNDPVPGVTTVNPADLESFAKWIDDVAKKLNGDDGYSGALQYSQVREEAARDGQQYPLFGQTFESGTQLTGLYDQKHEGMVKAADTMYRALSGLAAATRAVAQKYKSKHELAQASVSEVEKIMAEKVTPPQPGQPGADNGQQPQ